MDETSKFAAKCFSPCRRRREKQGYAPAAERRKATGRTLAAVEERNRGTRRPPSAARRLVVPNPLAVTAASRRLYQPISARYPSCPFLRTSAALPSQRRTLPHLPASSP